MDFAGAAELAALWLFTAELEATATPAPATAAALVELDTPLENPLGPGLAGLGVVELGDENPLDGLEGTVAFGGVVGAFGGVGAAFGGVGLELLDENPLLLELDELLREELLLLREDDPEPFAYTS